MDLIKVLQIVIAVLLITVILLQQRGSGLSGVFGGSGNIYRTKRGIEKSLYTATIILASLFFLISIAGVTLR